MIFRWRTIFDTQPAHTKIIKWYIPLNDFSPVYHYLHTTGAFKILRSHLMISCFAQKWYFLQWFVAPVCPQDWSSKIYHLMIFRRCTTIYTQPAASKFWEATQWFLVLCKTYNFCNDFLTCVHEDWLREIYYSMMFRLCTIIRTQPASSKYW